MNDEEFGLNFFTEGEPRTPDGLPSVFGAIDQTEMLARIDDVQEDDLASSFFSDSLIEVEAAATRAFDVRLRARGISPEPVERTVVESAAEASVAAERETVDDLVVERVTVEPAPIEHTAVEDRVVEEVVVEETPVTETGGAHSTIEHPVPEPTRVAETVNVEPDVEEPIGDDHVAIETPAARVSRLGTAREDVVAMPSRTVITVPGLLSKSADARRAFILGGPAAVNEE